MAHWAVAFKTFEILSSKPSMWHCHNRWTSNSEQSKPGWWPSITQRSGSAEWRPCWRSQRRRPRIVSRTWCEISSFLSLTLVAFKIWTPGCGGNSFCEDWQAWGNCRLHRAAGETSSVADTVLYATCCDRTPWKTSTPGVTTQTSWWTWSWRPPTSSTRRRWWVGLKSFGN